MVEGAVRVRHQHAAQHLVEIVRGVAVGDEIESGLGRIPVGHAVAQDLQGLAAFLDGDALDVRGRRLVLRLELDVIRLGAGNDPLLLGNSAAVAGVEIPDSVDIDIDGTIVTFDLDNSGTGVVVDSQVHVRECSTTSTDPLDSQVAFGADPAEVNAISMGASCDSGSTGYIVYFTTVDDAAS